MKHIAAIGLFVSGCIAYGAWCTQCVFDECVLYGSPVGVWVTCGAEDGVPSSNYCRDWERRDWYCKGGTVIKKKYRHQDHLMLGCIPPAEICT